MDITGSITDATKKVTRQASFTAQTIDGKVYAMPIAVLPGGFFYSKDLFSKAGITQTPTTLAELADRRRQAEGAQACSRSPWAPRTPGRRPSTTTSSRCASAVPATVTETAKTLSFDDPCWLKAGQDVQSFAATEPFNNGFLTTSAQQGAGSSAGLVANHKAAMELMGAWDPGVIASLTPNQKPLPDLDWFPFPEHRRRRRCARRHARRRRRVLLLRAGSQGRVRRVPQLHVPRRPCRRSTTRRSTRRR